MKRNSNGNFSTILFWDLCDASQIYDHGHIKEVCYNTPIECEISILTEPGYDTGDTFCQRAGLVCLNVWSANYENRCVRKNELGCSNDDITSSHHIIFCGIGEPGTILQTKTIQQAAKLISAVASPNHHAESI